MKKYLIISVLFVFVACSLSKKATVRSVPDYKLYEKSIADAMSPDSSKIFRQLVEINPENNSLQWKEIDGEKYVLTVSWKQNVSYYKPYLDSAFYNTGPYQIWITTAPELYKRMHDQQQSYSDTNLRLKQLLGLPPASEYSYFVEFWVKPDDLFRPCPDDEITDGTCQLCFPEGTDSTYINWINENRISRYYPCNLNDKYPWTQLGYTYDWNPQNGTHVGLSEFVIKANSDIVVKAIYTTEAYLKE